MQNFQDLIIPVIVILLFALLFFNKFAMDFKKKNYRVVIVVKLIAVIVLVYMARQNHFQWYYAFAGIFIVDTLIAAYKRRQERKQL